VKILYIVNDLAYFVSHRLPIAREALAQGHEVHVAGPSAPGLQLVDMTVHVSGLARGSNGLLSELTAFRTVLRLLRQIRPDLVHLVTSKPVIFGGIAARLAGVPSQVAAIAGLGYVFTSPSLKARFLRALVAQLYRLALDHPNSCAIFQNNDDRTLLVEMRLVKEGRTALVRGSGVSLASFPVVPEPSGLPHVVFAARLLGDKGLGEFVEAAKMLRARGLQARYTAIGDRDPANPTVISAEQIDTWKREGIVAFPGYQNDMATAFADANLIVLPSYREGLPKVLVEAAASGRAVVTTDVPGCRDAIIPGLTGLLVPVKNPAALADAIETLVREPELRSTMGAKGRELAEEAFSIEKIVAAHLDIYDQLHRQQAGDLVETAIFDTSQQ
jgi:glycosyltransferase involved in cell wall biosynthesis